MPEEKEENEDKEQKKEGETPKRGVSIWIALGALVLVVGSLGIWLWSARRAEPGPAADSGTQVKSTLHLESFVLNLADSDQRSYLRVGIDLGLGRETGKEDAPPVSLVRDTILGVLAQAKVDELLTAKGKESLKTDLLRALNERVPELEVQEIYASSQVDQRKVGRLALAIQVAFQELGVFPASNTQVPLNLNEPMPFSTVQTIQNVKRNTQLGNVLSPPKDSLAAAAEETDLSKLQDELQRALHNEITLHEVALHRESDGLVVSLREFGFFDSGSAAVKPEALPSLDRIASILAVRSCQLRIEGHTDTVPIHTVHMASNWELSTARATELVRLLIVRDGFAPERLSAAGYAEYHPIASNSTPQGRAQNRRVDIVILGNAKAIMGGAVQPLPNPTDKPSPAVP